MEFTPVALVSPTGRPWTARTAVELTNLTSKGYRPAPQEAAVEQPGNGYAAGGWIEPGSQSAINGTSEPEVVLNWDAVERLDGDLPHDA